MHTSGGRVSTVINGVQFLDPSNINISVASNGDGTNYRTVEATPRTAEISFDRLVDYDGAPLKWDEQVMRMVNMSVTFVEQDTGVSHLLTNACFTGKPSLDMGTGEISGVGIAADTYETIR